MNTHNAEQEKSENIYVGYEFGKDYCLISLMWRNMEKDPILVKAASQEDDRIPLLLAKKQGIEQWYYGNEAQQKVAAGQAVAVEDFYEKAQNAEMVMIEEKEYSAELLLQMYLKKTFHLLLNYTTFEQVSHLTFCVNNITPKQVNMWKKIQDKIPFPKERISVISYSEAFAEYVMTQEERMWQRGVILLDYDGKFLEIKALDIERSTIPKVIQVTVLEAGELETEDKSFFVLLKSVLGDRMAGMVYLVGKGFNSNWYDESLKLLCQGRRVFRGQNLYGMGALYYGMKQEQRQHREYLYLGEEQIQLNVLLPAFVAGKEVEYELVSAEEHWYEAGKTLEVLLGESRELIFYVTGLYGGRAQINFPLSELVLREEHTSRLRITVEFRSKDKGIFRAEDLGFGEIYVSSGKVWEKEIDVKEITEKLKAECMEA